MPRSPKAYVLAIAVVLALPNAATAGEIEIAGGLSLGGVRLLDEGGLEQPAFGPGISVTAIEPSTIGIALGLDVSAQMAAADGMLLSDFGASFMWSWLFDGRGATPFVSLGLSAAAFSIDEAGGKSGDSQLRDIAFGVNGNVGVHGFVGESWYWRAQIGYLGAGVGAVRSQVCLSYVFSSI